MSPFVFVFVSLVLRYGYNNEFYPYRDLSDEDFFRANIFALISLVTVVIFFYVARRLIKSKFGIDYLHIGFELVKADWVLILFNNLNTIFFSIALLLLHMDMWWFLFRRFPTPSTFELF